MNNNVMPTKKNLIITKNNLQIAQVGLEKLDAKHKSLLNKQNKILKKLEELKIIYENNLQIAKIALNKTEKFHGSKMANYFVENIDNDFNLQETSIFIDELVYTWKIVFNDLIEIKRIECFLIELNNQIKRTGKRSFALKNIIIPLYLSRIKYIQESLEEKERDDLIRNKIAKKFTQHLSIT